MDGLDFRSALFPGAGSIRVMQRHLRRLWKRYLKWPAPLWRLQGYACLSFAGYKFKFYVTNENFWFARRVQQGKYEREVREFLKGVVEPGDVFFDVGAWIGPYTLLASRLVQPGGWVYSFEPDPVARDLLERHLAVNHGVNVTVLPYGVTDRDGSAWLRSQRLGGSGSAVNQNEGIVEIQTVTLSSFCEKQKIYPSVIKIDVEGGEAKVFAGATEVLQRARLIVLEFHDMELREAGEEPSVFSRALFDLGRRIIVLHQRGGGEEGLKSGTELRRDATLTGTVNMAIF